MKRPENDLHKFYCAAVESYIKEFQSRFDIIMDFWVGDTVGEVAMFGDDVYNFTDIKYVIDNNIEYDWLHEWFLFIVYYRKAYINLDSYCRLRRDFVNEATSKGIEFELAEFEKSLLYMRIKSE